LPASFVSGLSVVHKQWFRFSRVKILSDAAAIKMNGTKFYFLSDIPECRISVIDNYRAKSVPISLLINTNNGKRFEHKAHFL
jgi:hypothetical protein